MKQFNLKPFLLVCFILLFVNCQKEEVFSETEEASFVTDNPIALDFKTKGNFLVNPYRSKENIVNARSSNEQSSPNIPFEEEYGIVDYPDLVVIDSSNTNTLFPLLDENRKVKGWLVGFFNEDSIIEYRVKKQETDLIIGEEDRLIYWKGDENLYYYEDNSTGEQRKSTAFNAHTNSSSRSTTVCGHVYENVCSSVDIGGVSSGGSSWGEGTEDNASVCNLIYKGYQCWESGTEHFVNNDNDGGGSGDGTGWVDPTDDTSGGGNPPDNSCPDGTVPDGYGNCLPVCDNGYVRNENGDCIKDPCITITAKNEDSGYLSKINELKGKTGLREENGYSEDINGYYTKLTAEANGHSINIPPSSARLGVMHTHLKNFMNGNIGPDGSPEIVKPLKMFSPADLRKFLNFVRNAHFHNRPLTDAYVTMVSSNGVYTLRFTGDFSQVNIAWNAKDRAIKKKYKQLIFNHGEEAGFLRFMRDIVKTSGISLYKVGNNGTIKEKKLNNTGKKSISIPCN